MASVAAGGTPRTSTGPGTVPRASFIGMRVTTEGNLVPLESWEEGGSPERTEVFTRKPEFATYRERIESRIAPPSPIAAVVGSALKFGECVRG